jgi:hypothetical protein
MAKVSPAHTHYLVTLTGIARAMKMESVALRSLLRGQESEYLKPIDDTPRGFYSCSDALLFACIASFESRMFPSEREVLRKAIRARRSVWQAAHFDGASAQIFIGIGPGIEHPILGSPEEISERSARVRDKRLGALFAPMTLDVGKLSDALHLELGKIQADHPEEVKAFEAFATIED